MKLFTEDNNENFDEFGLTDPDFTELLKLQGYSAPGYSKWYNAIE